MNVYDIRRRFFGLVKFVCWICFGNLFCRFDRFLQEKLKRADLIVFRRHMGYSFDMNNPKTLYEKIQWYAFNWHYEACKSIMPSFINSIFNSITYILPTGNEKDCWLVDCGDVDKVIAQGWHVRGVLLTHAHFDHIYGLNKLIKAFPEALVYTNAEGQGDLMNPRWNFSHYHEDVEDFVLAHPENVRVIEEECTVNLAGIQVAVFIVPGHDPSCLAFRIENALYTGDAYIPGVKVVTTFPRSNRQQAADSLARLQRLEASGLTVMPGHWMGKDWNFQRFLDQMESVCVDPCPDVPGYADQLRGDDRVVLKLRPGITGPATLKYRLEDEMISAYVAGRQAAGDSREAQAIAVEYNDTVIYPDKVRLNKYYYEHYSFWKDIEMIFATVLGRKVAYAGEEIWFEVGYSGISRIFA